MRERTDIHRPAVFRPEDYTALDCYDTRPEMPNPAYMEPEAYAAYMRWRDEYLASVRRVFGRETIPHTCDHCGHGGLRYIWAVEYNPTEAIIAMGDDCIRGGRLTLPNNAAFRLKFIQDKAARDRAHFQNLAKLGRWREANPEAAAFLDGIADDERFDFLRDLKTKLARYFELSEKQTAAILKIKARRDEQATARAAELAATTTGPAPEGTATVVGKVLKVKVPEYHGPYVRRSGGFPEAFKMLILLEDGNRVWGTVPAEFVNADIQPGTRVRFTATFTRKEEHFAFYSRPRKAEIVEGAA